MAYVKLMREWRCFPERPPRAGGSTNSWAGSPGNTGLGTYWTLRAIVAGEVGERTGYICSINDIDVALRDGAVPVLRRWLSDMAHGAASLAVGVREAFGNVSALCPAGVALDELELRIGPHLVVAASAGEDAMVRFTQSFEFAASHRLSCAGWSDEENRRVFGKCANVNGHGHNYVVEITVCGKPDDVTGSVADIEHMQRVVKERVVEPFDHKYLNAECPDFAKLNPSVENIARVIWRRLSGAFERCGLSCVRVWETAKTYAEYDGVDE